MSDMSYDPEVDESPEDDEPEFLGSDDEAVVDSLRRNFTLNYDESDVINELSGWADNPTFRGLIDRVVRLRQILGDKDAMIYDLSSEVISSLRLLVVELRTDPTNIVMSVLAQQDTASQLAALAKLQTSIAARLELLREKSRLDAEEQARAENMLSAFIARLGDLEDLRNELFAITSVSSLDELVLLFNEKPEVLAALSDVPGMLEGNPGNAVRILQGMRERRPDFLSTNREGQ